MAKIKNGFDRMSEPKLLVEATSIGTKCTDNAYFTSLQPTVVLVVAATTAYGEALDASKSGDKMQSPTRMQRKNALIALLRKLGDMVSGVAGGDYQILVSSGFPLVKDREPSQSLTKPAPPMLSAGLNSGEIVATGSTEKAAKSVIHMIAADPVVAASNWSSNVTTARKFTFSNLESGKHYWIKQGLVGVRKQYVESDAVSYIAQ